MLAPGTLDACARRDRVTPTLALIAVAWVLSLAVVRRNVKSESLAAIVGMGLMLMFLFWSGRFR
jgi:hypothetical protein